ncbi:MAG TPA: hypothetical protein VGJ95_09110, partial [Pseudonocardiaceae bacterium]
GPRSRAMDGTDELVGLFPPGTRQVGSEILRAEELAAAVAPLAAVGQYPVYDLGGGPRPPLHLQRRPAEAGRVP